MRNVPKFSPSTIPVDGLLMVVGILMILGGTYIAILTVDILLRIVNSPETIAVLNEWSEQAYTAFIDSLKPDHTLPAWLISPLFWKGFTLLFALMVTATLGGLSRSFIVEGARLILSRYRKQKHESTEQM